MASLVPIAVNWAITPVGRRIRSVIVSACRTPGPLPRLTRHRTATPLIGEASAAPGTALLVKIRAPPDEVTPLRAGSGLGPIVTAALAGAAAASINTAQRRDATTFSPRWY